MRILYIDMDSCRPDHLGCYGYHRDTTPNIDRLAGDAAIFSNCYASDAPCLPSRTALMLSQFGYRTGCVGHSGTANGVRYAGDGHRWEPDRLPLPWVLAKEAGHHTVSFSPFAERHCAWWFYAGWREMHNSGFRGMDIASQTNPLVEPWLRGHAKDADWFCHVNYWDPHRPYRTPAGYENVFANDLPPDWPDAETIAKQYESYGPRSASEPLGWNIKPTGREPEALRTADDMRMWYDGYDTGIRYMDEHIGRLLAILEDEGVLDETAIILSGDHGEQQGELNVYGDHHCADLATCRIPMIVRWPGASQGGRHDGLLYGLDLAPTLCEFVGVEAPSQWDGVSFADGVRGQPWGGRESLVIGQGAWTCQRSVIHGDHIMIRTYHDGFKPLPGVMLFDRVNDPHETTDLAASQPEVVDRLSRIQLEWETAMGTSADAATDPLMDVIREGGPTYIRGRLDWYCQFLRDQGKAWAADELQARHG